MNWNNNPKYIDKLLTQVAKNYNVGKVHTYTRLLGNTSKNYQIKTSSGEYIIKFLNPLQSEKTIHEIAYVQRINTTTFPGVLYRQSKLGYLVKAGPFIVVCLKKIHGIMPVPSTTICETIGLHLAKLHRIPYGNLPVKKSFVDISYIPGALQIVSTISREEYQKLLHEYKKVQNFNPATLPQSIIHADVTPGNSLFQKNALKAIIDWHEVTIGASMLDLAVSILYFCFPHNTFSPEFTRHIVMGYQQVRLITKQEKKALYTAVCYMRLVNALWTFLQVRYYFPDDSRLPLYYQYWDISLDGLLLYTP